MRSWWEDAYRLTNAHGYVPPGLGLAILAGTVLIGGALLGLLGMGGWYLFRWLVHLAM